MTKHVTDQLVARFKGLVPNPEMLLAKAQQYLRGVPYGRSVAMKVAVLSKQCGDTGPRNYYDRGSNGEEVFVIGRHGRCITVMFRRSEQPKLCERFDTNMVVDISGAVPVVLHQVETVVWRQKAS